MINGEPHSAVFLIFFHPLCPCQACFSLLSWLLKILPGPDGLVGKILKALQDGGQVKSIGPGVEGIVFRKPGLPVAHLRGRHRGFYSPRQRERGEQRFMLDFLSLFVS